MRRSSSSSAAIRSRRDSPAAGTCACNQPDRRAWPPLPGLPDEEQPMDDEEPGAVLTIGRLRLTQTLRFLRASAAAEELVVGDPALLASTGFARLPSLVATFSLWRTTAAMRAYARGHADPRHVEAVRATALARSTTSRPSYASAPTVRRAAGMVATRWQTYRPSTAPPHRGAPPRTRALLQPRPWAQGSASAGGGTRTPDTRIMIRPG